MTAIFSPEHGFRGTENAGATVGNSVNEKKAVLDKTPAGAILNEIHE